MNRLKLWLFRSLGVLPKCDHTETVLDDEGKVFSRENTCTVGGNHPVGDWGPPEPHPVPKFSARLKIQRRPVAAVLHCKKCGFVGITRGFDQRDIPQSEGGNLRNDDTPKRGL